MNLMTNSIPNT